MSNKDQTVAILQRLHSDRQAATNFVRNPASEWQALGGQLPAGVTPAQFSQRVRGGAFFKEVEATANGQMSAMAWSPCITGLVFFLNALGITGAVAATLASVGVDVAIAAFMGYEVSVVQATLATAGETTILGIATLLCHGH